MPRSGQSFVEIGLRQLDEPMVCHSCGAEVTEARVMKRSRAFMAQSSSRLYSTLPLSKQTL